MSVEATATTMRSYLDALLARGDFADYFSDDVTWTIVGTDQQVQGRKPVRDFLTWMHTQSLRRPPQGKDTGPGRWPSDLGGRLRRHPHRRVPWHAGHREVGPGALLCAVRPAGRQDRRPSRLHPHGTVHPTARMSEHAPAGRALHQARTRSSQLENPTRTQPHRHRSASTGYPS
jgi:hypothetical protein